MPSVTSQRAEFQNRVFQAPFLRVKKKKKNRLVLIFWEFTDSIIAGKHRVLHNGGLILLSLTQTRHYKVWQMSVWHVV